MRRLSEEQGKASVSINIIIILTSTSADVYMMMMAILTPQKWTNLTSLALRLPRDLLTPLTTRSIILPKDHESSMTRLWGH